MRRRGCFQRWECCQILVQIPARRYERPASYLFFCYWPLSSFPVSPSILIFGSPILSQFITAITLLLARFQREHSGETTDTATYHSFESANVLEEAEAEDANTGTNGGFAAIPDDELSSEVEARS